MQKKLKEKYICSNSGGWLTKLEIAAAVLLCGLMMPGNVMAAENSENVAVEGYSESVIGETDDDAASSQRLTSDDEVNKRDDDGEAAAETEDTGGVYDFKDAKTTGTVTVVKEWDDQATNDEREIPDIKISTKKPSKSALGYTVTFHGNGMKFDDGSEENMVVYNSAGEIVQGEYKLAIGNNVTWCRKPDGGGAVEISSDGFLSVPITEDVDLWAKEMTFEIKGYKGSPTYENDFNQLIPSTVTEVIFTDKIKPAAAEVIDVDADGDGGVVAWTENDGTVMKVSTQIKGIKVQAAVDSRETFYDKYIKKIDLKMLDTSKVTNMSSMFSASLSLTSLDLTGWDTSNVTDMSGMFSGCRGLTTSLDLTGWNTSNVTDMKYMFFDCYNLTSLDLTGWNTSNVTSMYQMFFGCRSLTNLDMSGWDTPNVASMYQMFSGCRSLTNLDMSGWDTSNVTSMYQMFSGCSGLKSLDLTALDTSNITDMNSMFSGCSVLKSLDLTALDTANVTDMSSMFSGCRGLKSLDMTGWDTSNVRDMSKMFSDCEGLTSLDLTPLDTSNVTDMELMFYYCKGLTSLDLTPLDTSKVTNMGEMFRACDGLTSLDLTPLDTSKVTNMTGMFYNCTGLTSITTGPNFKFVGTNYYLSGTWQNAAGETFNGNDDTANFPSNVADTYTKISN